MKIFEKQSATLGPLCVTCHSSKQQFQYSNNKYIKLKYEEVHQRTNKKCNKLQIMALFAQKSVLSDFLTIFKFFSPWFWRIRTSERSNCNFIYEIWNKLGWPVTACKVARIIQRLGSRTQKKKGHSNQVRFWC